MRGRGVGACPLARQSHVTLPHEGTRRLRGVIVHQSRDLGEGDVTERHGLAVAAVERTLIDCGGFVGAEYLTVLVDEAIRLGLTRPERLAARALGLRRPGRSGCRDVLELVATRPPGAEGHDSVLETLVARTLDDPAVPVPVHHFGVDTGPRTYELDFAWPDRMLAIETDGAATHLRAHQWQNDLERQAELVSLGWRILRFTWRDVTTRPDWVRAKVRRAMSPQ